MVLSRADSPPQWLSGATESLTAARRTRWSISIGRLSRWPWASP